MRHFGAGNVGEGKITPLGAIVEQSKQVSLLPQREHPHRCFARDTTECSCERRHGSGSYLRVCMDDIYNIISPDRDFKKFDEHE